MGNICRSPAAECFFRLAVKKAGKQAAFVIESAGTGNWHTGKNPDRRMQASAKKRNLEITGSARQVCAEDFTRFDWIFCMDKDNMQAVLAMGGNPDKTKLFLPFIGHSSIVEVPDPYYGGEEGFDDIVDLMYDATHALLDVMKSS